MYLFDRFRKRFYTLSFRNIALTLFIWLLTGFSLGTVTLLAPVRWIVNLGKSLHFSPNIESLEMKFVIVLFILVSFYISLIITKIILRKKSLILNLSLILLLLSTTSVCLWLWMNPELIQMGNRETTEVKTGNTDFFFGPYPSEQDLKNLKEGGYTAVISLLHPAVVPFEPKLLADEEEAAKKIGLNIINIPMLPWVSDNKSSVEEIKNITQNGAGKYYVHCYLGKDRVSIVKRIIHNYSSSIVSHDIDSTRILNENVTFERGKIFKIDEGVYLSPFPTDDEFIRYVLNGSIKKVVSLLNPKHSPDTMWINREQKILNANLMPYELLPIDVKPPYKNKLIEIAKKIKSMPRPLLVHAFLTKSPQTDAFIEEYKKLQ